MVTGTQDTQSIQIHNNGNAVLVVTSVATKQQSIFQPLQTAFTIPIGDSAALAVIFAPATAAPYADTLTIASNTAPSPDKIALFGDGTTTAVEELPQGAPSRFYQNYPNPFQASTRFRFTLPAPERAELTIVDMLGRRVETLASGFYAQGAHVVTFDGTVCRRACISAFCKRAETG